MKICILMKIKNRIKNNSIDAIKKTARYSFMSIVASSFKFLLFYYIYGENYYDLSIALNLCFVTIKDEIIFVEINKCPLSVKL